MIRIKSATIAKSAAKILPQSRDSLNQWDNFPPDKGFRGAGFARAMAGLP